MDNIRVGATLHRATGTRPKIKVVAAGAAIESVEAAGHARRKARDGKTHEVIDILPAPVKVSSPLVRVNSAICQLPELARNLGRTPKLTRSKGKSKRACMLWREEVMEAVSPLSDSHIFTKLRAYTSPRGSGERCIAGFHRDTPMQRYVPTIAAFAGMTGCQCIRLRTDHHPPIRANKSGVGQESAGMPNLICTLLTAARV